VAYGLTYILYKQNLTLNVLVWGSLQLFHMTCKCYSSIDCICSAGHDIEECRREVDLSIQRLFYWGAYTDKYGG